MITVLTATYNRKHTLKRLFDSLCEQTDKSFEWLLIDDGSTDGTDEFVLGGLQSSEFATRYVRQENGGKHVAINTGARLAEGEWILILDSDDALTPEAISLLCGDIAVNDSPDIAGFCYRKAFFNGSFVGETGITEKLLSLHPTEAAAVFKGDLAYAFRTSILRRHPFPVINGEKFVPELYVWNQIGDEGQILYFADKAIYLCEYLPDGYSENFASNLRRNPRGFGLFYRAQFFREKSFLQRLKHAIRAMQCLYFSYCLGRH